MYKDNRYYLEKMEENVVFILEHMNGVSKKQLESDPVLQDSMMLRLVQISENAKNLTDEFREQNTHIPWTYKDLTRVWGQSKFLLLSL